MPLPTIPTFNPQVRLTLYKTIQRKTLVDGVPVSERFATVGGKVDLTPYLGDGTSIRTSKSVREAAGGFSVTLVDKPFIGYLDSTELQPGSQPLIISSESVYGILEPMDVVEIRFRREVTSGTADQPPIIMRGFIKDIARNEAMGPDGRPARTVVFSGQDYGRVWQMLQIRYLPNYVIGQDTLSAFRLFERFGVGLATATKAGDFVREVMLKVINVYLQKLIPEGSPSVKTLVLDEDQLVGHGVTSLTGPQNHEGTIFDVLRTYLDVGAWNELFLEDREDGVFLVFRPNPYKTAAGAKIVEDAPDAPIVDVDADSIIALNVSRSDANVANYYWVHAPRFDLVDEMYRRQWSVQEGSPDKDTVVLTEYPNSSEQLYGMRLMFTDTQMGGDEVVTFNSGLPEIEKLNRQSNQVNWIDYRRRQLVAMNKDNVLFESGSVRLRGNENLRAGVYMKIKRGTFEAMYYVVSVTHEFLPYQGFFTTAVLERGTGFIERVKRNGGAESPYLAELAR